MAEATAATVVPTFDDVLAARERISRYLQPTALNRYPALDELIGTETWVKHENNQPVCAFKVGGGINLLSQLTEDERRRGVITASTGNHGQSIAYAARIFGVRAIVCVPEGANPVKVRSIRGLGAEIVTAVRFIIETTRNLAVTAGAAPLAAALRLKDRLKGKRLALILSGSNITTTQLRELLAER